MSAFLFQLELSELTDEVVAVIPTHRRQINKLFADGHVVSYSVSVQRNMIWCVINADTESEAMELVNTFPLYKFFTDVVCHPLLFHNVLPAVMPGISLN